MTKRDPSLACWQFAKAKLELTLFGSGTILWYFFSKMLETWGLPSTLVLHGLGALAIHRLVFHVMEPRYNRRLVDVYGVRRADELDKYHRTSRRIAFLIFLAGPVLVVTVK